ncbi:histo-blood group ABO system transferase-like isoform X2 [Spea bombifrons]|uniref:histo-blood group ABO system transferase-like isoform X2 n=1 Tax=Spea bombifrons TaxID=233779 RepID=UPI00234A9982|nr:histo-blood group ABO system transferase-like isoform X2 [Spea bombifrons]
MEIRDTFSRRRCYILAAFSFVFTFLFGWYGLKSSEWHPSIIFRCTVNKMVYAKPDVLQPPRTDVLTITPWLAPIVWNGFYNRDILNAQYHQAGVRIGLTVFAIKKYVIFIKDYIETAEKFFMVGHKVNYYIFTDRPNDIPNFTLAEGRSLSVLEVPGYKRWQDVTMRRMQMIRDHTRDRFVNEVDYLVCIDVDMVFSEHIGVEILGDVVGVIHPGFFGASRKAYTHERRPESAGYIAVDEGDFYYTGCFFGGAVEDIYKLTNFTHHAMLADKAKNMEALWHDESYLNKYFLSHKPTKVLSPEYAWNNYYGSPAVVKVKRLLHVDKDFKAVRSN